MIKKRIILILLIIGIILTISTVNATEDIQDPYNQTVINMNENIEINEYNQENMIIGNKEHEPIIQNSYIYSEGNDIYRTKLTLTINDTTTFNTTGNITLNIHMTSHLKCDEKYFNNTALKIYDNNTQIGQLILGQQNIPPYKYYDGNEANIYTCDITFPYHVQYKTGLTVFVFGVYSNVLSFDKMQTTQLTNLTSNSININNRIHSNSSWTNSIKSIQKAIELAQNGDTIFLSNINILSNLKETVSINKNITIIGNNATFNGLEQESIFKIASNAHVTLINLTFTNTTNCVIDNGGNLNIINTTFKTIIGKAITNTKTLKITNTTIEDTDPIYCHPKIIPQETTLENGIIENTGQLEITDSVFNNITLPTEIQITKNTMWYGIIYNLKTGTTTINNAKFTNIQTRAIKNEGELEITNTLFENITSQSVKLTVNSTNYKTVNSTTIYQSYIQTKATLDGGAIHNTKYMKVTNSIFNNVNGNDGGSIYTTGTGIITNSKFNNNTALRAYGGSIYNSGNLNINNITITKSEAKSIEEIGPGYTYVNTYSRGGGIYNNGTLIMTNSTITQSSSSFKSNGGAISNDGVMTLDTITLFNNTGTGIVYNGETGEGTITNSLFKNNNLPIHSGYPSYYYGALFNEGKLTITKSIFDANKVLGWKQALTGATGSLSIYNSGEITIKCNLFINTHPLPKPVNSTDSLVWAPYSFIYSETTKINIIYNYFGINNDIFSNNVIGVGSGIIKVNNYFVLRFDPEYFAVDINDTTKIKVSLQLNTAIKNYEDTIFNDWDLLPKLNVTITTLINGVPTNITKELINGSATIDYSFSDKKTQYTVYAYCEGQTTNATIDIGKEHANMTFDIKDIIYKEDLIITINVTGVPNLHKPTGNISYVINNKKYYVNLVNGQAKINISNLKVGDYVIKINYEGDDDYFKIFTINNFTVHKIPTTLELVLDDFKIGETGLLIATLAPENVKLIAQLYIDGKLTQNLYLYGGTTSIPVRNMALGTHNFTVKLIGTDEYESTTATVIFKVTTYETNMTVNASDVKVGENATISIKINPGNVRGEAIISINGVNQTIFINDTITNVTLSNLNNGTYNITVYYPGDSKYSPCNASTSFKVLRNPSKITVNVTYDEINLTGTITVITTPNNCTGTVGVYINNKFYQLNLTNGKAVFNVEYSRGNNYIYVYYPGDSYYESATWNTTITLESKVKLTGENLTISEQDNSNYTILITDLDGNPYEYALITIILENKNYTLQTNSKGIGKFPLNLKAGTYTILAIYGKTAIKNTITVKPANMNIDIKDILAGEIEEIKVTLPETATGSITFVLDGKTYVKTLKNGEAILEIPNLELGKHTLKVIYSGDDKYTNNTKTLEFNIKNSLSKTEITINKNNTIYGEEITVTAKVTPGATGNVTFKVDNQEITTNLINGTAKATFNKINAGLQTITARYNGNNIYQGSANNIQVNINKAQSNITIITSEIVEGENILIYAVVNDDATGNVTFRILGLYSPRNKTISNGNASWLISPLTSGSYTINAYYNGDNNYLSSNTTKILVINQTRSILKVNVEIGENEIIFSATLKTEDGRPITGNVTLELNKEFYKIVITDGVGFRSFDKLPEGKYTYSATYKGTDKISRATDNGTFEIKSVEYNVILNAPDVKMIYHDGTRFIATLTDKQGNPIRDAAIEITINGKTYTKTTDEKGVVSLGLSLDSGIYTVTVNFKGTADYTPITRQAKVTIEPTVKGLDVVKMFRNDTQYYAIFTDSQGNPLKNKDVQFNINGVFYTKTTNDKGIAMMGINLNPGKYVITAINLVTGEQSGNNITVKSLIVQNDLTKYYLNDSRFQTTIYNKDGSLAANKEVTFNINGVFYHKKTDENGIASLGISLRPGEYIITTMVDGLSIGNKVNVLPTLITKNLNMKYLDGSSFTAQTLDGQGKPIANQNVSFNVNGVFYHKLTDNNGIAKLGIRLMAGEYIITSYWNDFQTGNTIKIE